MNRIVPLDRLEKEGYGRVICYPKLSHVELSKRIAEIRQLGVKELCFTGEKNVNNIPVLGKGYVGIVVLALTETGKIALKIRRTDADRTGMSREAEMLRIANSVGVGPRLLGFTENVLAMDFIDGKPLYMWIETLEGKDAGPRVRKVIREILEQCWRLDEKGLVHGELSRAPKHILVDADSNPRLLDFETASVTRRVSNVTQVCNYLFMKGKTADLVNKVVGEVKRDDFLAALKLYKKSRTREEFEAILRACLV